MIPQTLINEKLERSVLGLLLSEINAFNEYGSQLNEDCFTHKSHKATFNACLELHKDGLPIDFVLVADALKSKMNEPLPFVLELTSEVASDLHVKDWVLKLNELSIARTALKLTTNAFTNLSKGLDPFNTIDALRSDLENLEPEHLKQGIANSVEAHKDVIKQYESGELGSGVYCGLQGVDECTNGFDKGNLVILAARPSMGKTAFSLELAKHTAANGVNVAFFSLEMTTTGLMSRMLANYESLPLEGIKRKNLTEPLLKKMIESKVGDLKIYFDDTPAQSVMGISTKAKKLKRKHDIGCVIIDYLQLITPSKTYKDKNNQIGEISRQLKQLAKELDCPVIALSQLSRQVESRSDKRPQMSDLRDSGAIEQDADVVMFLYREAYYDKNLAEELQGKTEVLIKKNRDGELGDFDAEFIGKYQQFREWTYDGVEIKAPTYTPF